MSTGGHTPRAGSLASSLALTNQLHWCIVLLKEPKCTTNRLYLSKGKQSPQRNLVSYSDLTLGTRLTIEVICTVWSKTFARDSTLIIHIKFLFAIRCPKCRVNGTQNPYPAWTERGSICTRCSMFKLSTR